MNNCSTCGEYKACRKIVEYCSDNGYPYYFLRPFTWRCKDCDDYFKYLNTQIEQIALNAKLTRQKNFVIARNKILKKIKK